MKKMIVSAFMLAAIATGTYAQDVKATAPAAATPVKEDDNSKTKVDPETLPDAVKTTLAGDTYKDWKVSSAWLMKAEPVFYTVELKNGEKTTSVNIDKDGKVKP